MARLPCSREHRRNRRTAYLAQRASVCCCRRSGSLRSAGLRRRPTDRSWRRIHPGSASRPIIEHQRSRRRTGLVDPLRDVVRHVPVEGASIEDAIALLGQDLDHRMGHLRTVGTLTGRHAAVDYGPESLRSANLHQQAGKVIAAQFLRNLVTAVSYVIHTVLMNNRIQFTDHAHHRYAFHHIFDRVCGESRIEHRLAKVKDRGTTVRACPGEGRGRTDEPTIRAVKRYHYDSHDQLRQRLSDFVAPKISSAGSRPSRAHPLRSYLQGLAERAKPLRNGPTPPITETKRLARRALRDPARAIQKTGGDVVAAHRLLALTCP
jgi:hypothetical protein